MKKILTIIFLLNFSTLTFAECHFKTPSAIACLTPEAAALAFKKYGDNIGLVSQSYTKQILLSTGCAWPKKEVFDKIAISQVSGSLPVKIATDSGWVVIEQIFINDKFEFNAKNYLSGVCARAPISPEHQQTPIDYSMPPDGKL